MCRYVPTSLSRPAYYLVLYAVRMVSPLWRRYPAPASLALPLAPPARHGLVYWRHGGADRFAAAGVDRLTRAVGSAAPPDRGHRYKDGEILEDLTLTATEITLIRHGPRGLRKAWQANPHWVRITLHKTKGPVPDYLTLTGNGREVELGAFLPPEDRVALEADLRKRLAALR